jgi:hypothetical protein
MKANEVIKIGRKARAPSSIAAFVKSIPFVAGGNSTIKMAFLASNPISMIKAT